MKKSINALLLILLSLAVFAQPNKVNQQIVIAGKISDSMMPLVTKAPYITLYSNYNQDNTASQRIVPLNIKGGEFKIEVSSEEGLLYFDFGNGMIRSITNDVFLISQGDSIYMDIKGKNDVLFSGKGAEKLSYQNWAGKFINSDKKKWGPNDNMVDHMLYNRKRAIRFLALTLDQLNKDTSINDVKIRNILRLNVASSISRQYLNSITNDVYFTDTAYYNKLKGEVNFLITQQNGFVVNDSYLIENSFMYVQYLFELNKAIAKIRTKSWKVPISIVYNNIKAEFRGILLDKLIAYCFLDLLKIDSEGLQYLPKALTLVHDSACKALLTQIKNARSKGVKAFDFDLQTLDHKRIKLNDLKGKVIILETYYAGCVPCRQLSINMESIAEYFKSRKDVVFISLDGIAKDFYTFEKGAKSKEYGYKQSIYAWTEGLGIQHPLLTFYNYNSFPNLLIIGKDGGIISAQPERPFNDEGSKTAFKEFINKNL